VVPRHFVAHHALYHATRWSALEPSRAPAVRIIRTEPRRVFWRQILNSATTRCVYHLRHVVAHISSSGALIAILVSLHPTRPPISSHAKAMSPLSSSRATVAPPLCLGVLWHIIPFPCPVAPNHAVSVIFSRRSCRRFCVAEFRQSATSVFLHGATQSPFSAHIYSPRPHLFSLDHRVSVAPSSPTPNSAFFWSFMPDRATTFAILVRTHHHPQRLFGLNRTVAFVSTHSYHINHC
jgi:hypothetical protein